MGPSIELLRMVTVDVPWTLLVLFQLLGSQGLQGAYGGGGGDSFSEEVERLPYHFLVAAVTK